MKRRNFLRTILAGGAALYLPQPATRAYSFLFPDRTEMWRSGICAFIRLEGGVYRIGEMTPEILIKVVDSLAAREPWQQETDLYPGRLVHYLK